MDNWTFREYSTAPDLEALRRLWYRKGKEEGLRQRATVYVCSSCQIAHQAPGTRLMHYLHEQHQDVGPLTEEHRALHWQQH